MVEVLIPFHFKPFTFNDFFFKLVIVLLFIFRKGEKERVMKIFFHYSHPERGQLIYSAKLRKINTEKDLQLHQQSLRIVLQRMRGQYNPLKYTMMMTHKRFTTG